MADTIKKRIPTRVKGTTQNGKPGGPTIRSPRAKAKLTRKRKKTPPAQAEKKQARSVSNAASAVLVPPGTRAADLLSRGAEIYIEKNWDKIIEGLGDGARKGHPMNAKTLREWASAKPPVPSNSPDRAALTANLGEIHSEPDHQQSEDRGGHIHPEVSELPEEEAATVAT